MSEYEVYRTTTLGLTLQETLDDFLQMNQIRKETVNRIYKEYDKSIAKALNRIKTRIEFKSKLHTYRLCDNVWTLVFNGIEINYKEPPNTKWKISDKIKIVACDGKSDKKVLKASQYIDEEGK